MMTMMYFFSPTQFGGGGDGREAEHAGGDPHRARAVRGAGAEEVAVRRLVQRRHHGQPDGGKRGSRVSARNVLKTQMFHFSTFLRRVHVTQTTLEHLRGEYEVEPGPGLREHGISSYFIVPPPRRRKSNLLSSLRVSITCSHQ